MKSNLNPFVAVSKIRLFNVNFFQFLAYILVFPTVDFNGS